MAYQYQDRSKQNQLVTWNNGVKKMRIPKLKYAAALDSAIALVSASREAMLAQSLTGETDETLHLAAVHSTLAKLRSDQPNTPKAATMRTKIVR